jgi:hypothetical protein
MLMVLALSFSLSPLVTRTPALCAETCRRVLSVCSSLYRRHELASVPQRSRYLQHKLHDE